VYEVGSGDMWNDKMDDLTKKTKYFDYYVTPSVFVHDKLVRGDISG
jgi:hypothetical protein